MKTVPASVASYLITPKFDESSIPKGLLNAHQSKEGVWANIVVNDDRLEFSINDPDTEIVILDKDNSGGVEPRIRHQVKAIGAVRFHVEFYI